MKKFHDFWRYNDQFYEKCAHALVKKVHEVDFGSLMATLLNGNVTHLKRHAQLRIMYNFMIKGVKILKIEQNKLD